MAVPPRFRTRRARRRYLWKVIVAVVASVLLMGLGVLAVIWALPLPSYADVEAVEPQIEATPERVERGRRLVAATCAGCHASAEDPRLVGRPLRELPRGWGDAVATNLTRHKGAGIKAIGDGELVRALRTGIAHDGVYMPPYMPRYPRMADEDLAAVVAFLRSDDPWVESSSNRPGSSAPSFVVKLRSRLSWRPHAMPTEPIERPSRDDALALGAYLVEDVLQCNGCHGSNERLLTLAHPLQDPSYLGGGVELADVNGKRLVAPNITLEEDTGIGGWTLDDFRKAMVEGVRPDGVRLRWPMRRYAMLDDVELAAIFTYLASVPEATRPRPERHTYPTPGQRLDRGRHLFFKHECFSCHGDRAPHGVLEGAAAHFETDAAIVEFLRDPSRTRPGTQMPAYGEVLEAADLEVLAAYVRAIADPNPNKL